MSIAGIERLAPSELPLADKCEYCGTWSNKTRCESCGARMTPKQIGDRLRKFGKAWFGTSDTGPR
jgi:methionyl-tRNA synthetase